MQFGYDFLCSFDVDDIVDFYMSKVFEGRYNSFWICSYVELRTMYPFNVV